MKRTNRVYPSYVRTSITLGELNTLADGIYSFFKETRKGSASDEEIRTYLTSKGYDVSKVTYKELHDAWRLQSTRHNNISSFEYDVSSNDPSNWRINYDQFFELIRNILDELKIEYDEDDAINSNILSPQKFFTLNYTKILDSNELETDILYALANGTIKSDGQKRYIIKYIKSL